MNLDGIKEATGQTWDAWLAFLDGLQASELPHAEVAKKVEAQGEVSSWWAQTITVAYEQHIGRRQPGQTSNGKFQTSVSRTLDGTMDEVLDTWLAVVAGRQEFSGVPISRAPTTSQSEQYRYWHCGLSDGSRVSVGISQKSSGKAVIGLGHENLESIERIDHWRAFWKSLLAKL